MDELDGVDSGEMDRTGGTGSHGGPGEIGPPGGSLARLDGHKPGGRVVFRDLIIFQIKLVLDGVGDLILAPLSVFAFLFDLLPGRRNGKLFYRVLRVGERWDRWLSLYRPAHEAGGTEEGLLGAGQIDADTFLGKVEEVVGKKGRSLRPNKTRDGDR